jgi:quinol monooxygenase YgiN
VQVQLKKDYYKSYAAETEPLWIKPREIEIWERMPSREWTKSKRENFM